MSLIDYNLQSGISSDRHTGDGDERYSMKEGLNNIANAFGSFLSTQTKANQQLLKAQATANENAFADDMYKLYKKSTTTEMTDTQRMDEQQKIWDKYASVAPDTKYKIGEYYGFKAPTNMAWSLAEKQRGAIVTKADEETKRDYDMGVYVLGSDAVNMSPEEVIEVGKQTMLDRTMYASTVDYMVQQDPSKADLKDTTAYLASNLLRYSVKDIKNDIDAGTKIDELYVMKKKNALISKLMADGIPERDAMETANYLYYDLDSIAKLNTLTDKEKLEAVKRDNETGEAIFKKNFFDITHVPYDSFANLSRNLEGLDPDKRKVILSLGNYVFKAGELTFDQKYSLDDAYKGHAAMMGSASSSGQQKTNTGTILAHANVVNNAKGMSQADATGKQKEFLNSSFVNNVQVLKEMVKVAPVMNEVLGRMTRAEQQEYIRSNKANLEMTAVLAVGKMAQDVESPVVFNRETGQFELYGEGRKRTSDIRIVQAVNDTLKDIKYVQDTVEGRFGKYEDIVKILMQEEIQQALHFKNDPLDPLTLWNHLTNSVKTMISSAWGGTDAEFLWQTERQGVRTSNIRRITGVTSPITDTLTSPKMDPFTMFLPLRREPREGEYIGEQIGKPEESIKERFKKDIRFNTRNTFNPKNGAIGYNFNFEELSKKPEYIKNQLEEIAPGITTGEIKKLGLETANKVLDVLATDAVTEAVTYAGKDWNNLGEIEKRNLVSLAYSGGLENLTPEEEAKINEGFSRGNYSVIREIVANRAEAKDKDKREADKAKRETERENFKKARATREALELQKDLQSFRENQELINSAERAAYNVADLGEASMQGAATVLNRAGEALGELNEGALSAGEGVTMNLEEVYNKTSEALKDLADLEVAEPSVEYYKTLEGIVNNYLNTIAETGGEVTEDVIGVAIELLDSLDNALSSSKTPSEKLKKTAETFVEVIPNIGNEILEKKEEVMADLTDDQKYKKKELQKFYASKRTKSLKRGGTQEKIDAAVNDVIAFLDQYKSLKDLPEGSFKATENPIANIQAEEDLRPQVEDERVIIGKDKNGKDIIRIVPTIGYGFRVATLKGLREENSETGKKLKKIIPDWDAFIKEGTNEAQATRILEVLYERSKQEASKAVGQKVFNSLTKNQREALTDIFYNLGNTTASSFKEMISAIQNGDFRRAAYEVVNSDAATYTVPKRYTRNAWKMYH